MSSQCPCCNQIVPYGADINMPNVGTVGHIDYGNTISETSTEAEKAKADKLALLHEVAEEYYKRGKSAEEWVTLREVLNMLKQRIEAE